MVIRKLGFRAFQGHVLGVTFLVGLLATFLMGSQESLSKAEESVKSSLGVLVFLQTALSDGQAKEWGDALRKRDPEIESYTFISKDQAYQEALKDPAVSKSLMLLKENPLPASFSIRLSDHAWWERTDPAERIKGAPFVQEIRWDPPSRSLYRGLHQWRLWLIRLSVVAGALLLIWTFLGLFRFFYLRLSVRTLVFQLGLGLMGSAVALFAWALALNSVQAEPAVYRPVWFSFLPLAAGMMAAVACLGVVERHD